MLDGVSRALAVLITVQGCSVYQSQLGSVPSGNILPKDELEYAEVLKAFGAPMRIFAHSEGFYFVYEAATIRETQLGVSFDFQESDTPVLSLFKFVYARGDVKRSTLLIAFDHEGIRTAHVERNWDEPLGSGKGLQLLISAMPLVDDSHLRDGAPQNFWGSTLLRDQNDDRRHFTPERLLLLGAPLMPHALRP